MHRAARRKTPPRIYLLYFQNEPYDFLLTCLSAFPGKNNLGLKIKIAISKTTVGWLRITAHPFRSPVTWFTTVPRGLPLHHVVYHWTTWFTTGPRWKLFTVAADTYTHTLTYLEWLACIYIYDYPCRQVG